MQNPSNGRGYYRLGSSTLNSANSSVGTGVPASRSSSSGSSIGHNVVVVRKTSTGNRAATGTGTTAGSSHHSAGNQLSSTSFKENNYRTTNASPSRANIARSAILVKATMSNAPSTMVSQNSPQRSSSRGSSTSRSAGFMRPTTASSTKRNK